MILSGADNRPPMLDKDLYDSWKSRMELYMQNREHRRMILESVENSSLIWPTIEENGVTRTKEYAELSAEQFQVNTKFLNSLPPKWSKFVTDVKLVKDLHTTNFDQLHAYLEQHELYANEIRLLRECNQDPLIFYGSIHPNQHYSSTYLSQPQFNHSSVQPSYPYQSQMNHQTLSVLQIAYQSPQVTTQLMTESPLVDSSFDVPVFSQGDDPISCLNKAMAFLTVVASSSAHVNKASSFYDNIHKQALGYKNPFYLKKAQRIKPTLYDGIVISAKHVAMHVIDDEETLILEEESRSKMLVKEKDPEDIKGKFYNKPIGYVKMNKLCEDFRKRFVQQQEFLTDGAFGYHMLNPSTKSSDALLVKIKAPKELP
uniref:Gag-Pol polyprotein n=1 Tax=Tanacetum cinerariifolium TaxID=118510 RepID=A0A699GR76_TANCI|nr:hypothetical protein [Tanacetum cinerariifolium]